MEILEEGSCFVVPCREWAAVHLDRHIRYSYGTKRNALRLQMIRNGIWSRRYAITANAFMNALLFWKLFCSG